MEDKQMELKSGWELWLAPDGEHDLTDLSDAPDSRIPASVPGDWPLDAVRAGWLEEPFFQDQYLKLRAYETCHVYYGVRFRWEGDTARTFLRFDGIDTVADVYLNGQMIGHAENMLIPHEFEACGLRQGENELLVHLRPVTLEARKHPIGAFESHLKYNYEALVIRKAAHSFGWDIMPRIVSSGLWRPVRVIRRKKERIEDGTLWVERLCPDGSACCRASFDVEIGNQTVQGYTLCLTGRCGDSVFSCRQELWYVHGQMSFTVKDARLWWPRGYGDACLYEVTWTLLKDGQAVDTLVFRQGLRTVALARTDTLNAEGQGDFCFVLNGLRVYVKGTNWVPADAFHSRDAERIPKILPMVTDIGCNALRVWGGGVYESDGFYDFCDENGVMVWQDFMMACGVYPHSERMRHQLEEEVRSVVRQLRRHACVCLWAGDNECDQSYCWHDLKQDPSANLLTRQVVPGVLQSEDWTRPYLPSSPYVSHAAYLSGHEHDTPEQHLWGPRDYFKGKFYHDATALFASEMGYHGCNSPASLYRFISREESWPVDGNKLYLYHAASPEASPDAPYAYRIPLMTRQLKYLFGQDPQNLDEYARMSQISQAEAKKFFVESFRSRKGERNGLIWWNLMDGWPQVSDAVVDYDFVRKLAYFFIRRSQQPVCLMMDDHVGHLTLYGVNDRLTDAAIAYEVTDEDTGETVSGGEVILRADSVQPLSPLPDDGKTRFYRIVWKGEGENGSNHYVAGRPPYDFAWYMKHLKNLGYDEFEGFDA